MAQLENGLAQSDTNFNVEFDTLRAQMATNAAEVTALQGETRQMAETIHAHATALTTHANEIASFRPFFGAIRQGMTNHENQINQLRQSVRTADQPA